MVAVPAATPVTTPAALTVAMDIEPLVQVPPVAVSARVVLAPTQTAIVPVIVPGDGSGVIRTNFVALTEPQEPETV